jgi:hypothetical protein
MTETPAAAARRVLIVSAHFPPVNAPDHQRVRMSLPHLGEFGWQAHVLAVAPEHVEGFRDPDLVRTIPAETPVTRVGAVPARWTRLLGVGSLGVRAWRSLRKAGERLLGTQRFDLVYFSTTVFTTMSLGPRWKFRFGVPYVLDIQDPWVSDYYSRTGVRPPGGRLKYGLVQWLARRAEPTAVREAAHIVCVSPAYPNMLRARYPDVPADRFTVLPFGASERDMHMAASERPPPAVFDPADGKVHWVYLGRGGPDMARGLRALFAGLRSLRAADPRTERLRLHFVGTSYSAGDRAERTVEPLARELGVGDLVEERTNRVGYLDGLALLQASDAVLIIGSDDPGYSASKVYPCILARRPILAVLHSGALAGKVISDCRAGEVVEFTRPGSESELIARVGAALVRLLDQPRGARLATDWEAFAPYTAREMTRRQCEAFDRAIGRRDGRTA